MFLHPTAIAALRAYEQARDQAFPEPEAATFFVNSRGGPLDEHNTQHTFAALVAAAGIQAPPGQRAPRLHDLRHVFTVATMLDWYRDGGDVQARLPLLSTWLGHVDPKSTYWYLQAVPELLALAAGRLEQTGRERPRDRPRPRPAGVLHRPAGPAEEGQPEHGRGLPRHVQAPARLRAGPDREATRQAQPRRPRRHADRRVPAATWKTSGGTAAPPATPGWPRSTRCSATRPRGHPSTPP